MPPVGTMIRQQSYDEAMCRQALLRESRMLNGCISPGGALPIEREQPATNNLQAPSRGMQAPNNQRQARCRQPATYHANVQMSTHPQILLLCETQVSNTAAWQPQLRRPQCVRSGCCDGAFGEQCRANLSSISAGQRKPTRGLRAKPRGPHV